MCNTKPTMPAPGGVEKLVGNNPISIGLPAAAGPDFLLDMALSEAALGEIRVGAGRDAMHGVETPRSEIIFRENIPAGDGG